ncbi:hypothetical protein BBF96_10925 [Anoxybacter fermentans]|uniref:Flagellar Assembly Protein A N-terminal region domain-containing protein n=1 Tax=Anoxybacter fermentans TaxID=1323375 RepID=A0A3Q9HSQ9_9FIRM|nr:hypothetical protein BBF96_10925 [Anoxybacter fermentans]
MEGSIEREQNYKANNLDGYFELKIKSDGIFLKVVAPKGNGKPVNLDAIKQMIERKELVDVDFELVEKTYHDAKGEFVKIAERKPELDRDADLEVEISSDEMSAFCRYIPPLGGKLLTLEEAVKVLNKKGVTFGIKKDKLKKLLEDNVRQGLEIATGQPPEDGKPAKFRYHFRLPEEKKHVKELEDGSVDFYNLDLVVNVKKGDLLVTKIPPTQGKSGWTVTGKEIKPKPGKDLRLPKGKNVEISEDGMSLLAGIDGQVVLERDKVSVLPIYTVEGDVDLETGNIEFIGNVIVKGNVQEGFSIKAGGDIEVMGNVEAANLEAKGKVIVHKGFKGKQKGLIKAERDVEIGFIENGQVITHGSLIVKGAIMHSTVMASKDVIVEGRGLIVGGTVQAGNDIVARVIGSHLATPTHIIVGVDPGIRQQLEEVEAEIASVKENLDKVTREISLLRKVHHRLSKLPPEKSVMLRQFNETREHLEGRMKQLTQQHEMLITQSKEQKNGRIKVLERVYPGVVINIGQVGYRVKDSITRTVFVYEEGEVRPIPL